MDNFSSLHYNSISDYLQNFFGARTVKLSIDAGMTCPNRDGKCGYGGCSFCSESGSGDFASGGDIRSALEEQKKLLSRKWGGAAYLAYFQSHTNTYAPPEMLREIWDEALAFPGIRGLAIATRPDCLQEEIMQLLKEYNKKTFLWIELGLQTSNEKTAKAFNRCYENDVFEDAIKRLSEANIRPVVHLMLGLPGETRDDMLRSAEYAASFDPFGIKLHMLHLLKGTAMAQQYGNELAMMSMEEYVNTVCDILERLPKDITIHRLTGDAPRSLLIAPQWSVNKHTVLNAIQKEFKRRGSCQGMLAGR